MALYDYYVAALGLFTAATFGPNFLPRPRRCTTPLPVRHLSSCNLSPWSRLPEDEFHSPKRYPTLERTPTNTVHQNENNLFLSPVSSSPASVTPADRIHHSATYTAHTLTNNKLRMFCIASAERCVLVLCAGCAVKLVSSL